MYELANPYYMRRRSRRNPEFANPRRRGGRRHNPVDIEKSVRRFADKDNLIKLAGAAAGVLGTQKVVDQFKLAGWMKVVGAAGTAIGGQILGSMIDKDFGEGVGIGAGLNVVLQTMAELKIGGVQQGSLVLGGNHPQVSRMPLQLGGGMPLQQTGAPKGSMVYKP